MGNQGQSRFRPSLLFTALVSTSFLLQACTSFSDAEVTASVIAPLVGRCQSATPISAKASGGGEANVVVTSFCASSDAPCIAQLAQSARKCGGDEGAQAKTLARARAMSEAAPECHRALSKQVGTFACPAGCAHVGRVPKANAIVDVETTVTWVVGDWPEDPRYVAGYCHAVFSGTIACTTEMSCATSVETGHAEGGEDVSAATSSDDDVRTAHGTVAGDDEGGQVGVAGGSGSGSGL